MPPAPLAAGLAVEAAKDALEDLIAEHCPTVNTVLVGGSRDTPDVPNIVWLQATTNISTRQERGLLTIDSFDLRLLIEASTPADRVAAGDDRDGRQVARDREQDRETRQRRWMIAGEIGEALRAHRGALDVSSSVLAVTGEESAYVDGYWVARAFATVRCKKTRTGR